MLDMEEINRAIAELEAGKTSSSSCSMLATLYTVRDHAQVDYKPIQAYSRTAENPDRISQTDTVQMYGDSDFLVLVSGKLSNDAWKIMDDLMNTLRIANPRVYESYMGKIRQI